MKKILKKIFLVLMVIALTLSSGGSSPIVYANHEDNTTKKLDLENIEIPDTIRFFEDGILWEITNVNNPEKTEIRKVFFIGFRNSASCLPGDAGYPICNRLPKYSPKPPSSHYEEEKHNPLINWIKCVTKKTLQDLGLTVGFNIVATAYGIFKTGGKHLLGKYIANLIPGANKVYWMGVFLKNGAACILGW